MELRQLLISTQSMLKCNIICLLLCVLVSYAVFAQQDSTQDATHKFGYRDVVLPSALFAVGLAKVTDYDFIRINNRLRNFVSDRWNTKHATTIDDKLQYFPMAMVYALNLCQYRGQHEFFSRSIILLGSATLTTLTVRIMKNNIREKRPDVRAFNSFPSGHSATAFMGAEFMWQEYKEKNKLVALSGYALATSVAMLRIYNNRHWFSDVCMGAGIGIFYTKLAYMIYPMAKKLFIHGEKDILVMPFYVQNDFGASTTGVTISLTI